MNGPRPSPRPAGIVLAVACAAACAAPAAGDAEPSDSAVETLPTTGPLCSPGAPESFTSEGEAVSVTLTCSGEGSPGEMAIPDLPAGADFDGSSGQFSWVPALDQAGVWTLGVTIPDRPGDVGEFRIDVADAWWDDANVAVDPTTYREEWGVPVMHLTRPPETNPNDDVPAETVWRGHHFDIGLKYRGASSLYYPKNSYTLSFPPDDEFEDETTDFQKRRKIVLTTTFDDNSYVRQKLCFDVWNALTPTRTPVQSRFVVVYINGAYEGLYLLGDHIDGEYWEDAGHREDGNLYKSVDHSANFYDTYNGRPKRNLHSGYEKKEGDIPDGQEGAWDDLDGFVSFVVNEPDKSFATNLESFVEVDEFLDWWILVTFSLAEDSGGKNAYLYNDPLAPRWHFAPWDFNHSWGQAWESSRTSAETNNDFTSANNLFRRIWADPVLGPRLLDRLHEDFDTSLTDASLGEIVSAYYLAIDRSAGRDWEKWGESYRSYFSWRSDFTTYPEERAYLETWIAERGDWMRSRYP